MADRVVSWHVPDTSSLASLPRFYSDADYEKVALRVYADTAPITDDLKIDIQADGVSIFSNLPDYTFTTAGMKVITPTTTPILNKGEQENATDDGDFNGDLISEGAWITLSIPDLKGAKGLSISLELKRIDEAST